MGNIVHYFVSGLDNMPEIILSDLPVKSSCAPIIIWRVHIQLFQLLCQLFVFWWLLTLKFAHPVCGNSLMLFGQKIGCYFLYVFCGRVVDVVLGIFAETEGTL